jgi:hypothetical protein
MRMLERCSMLIESMALLGPSTVAAWLLATALSGFLFTYRLACGGYYRCFFSTK